MNLFNIAFRNIKKSIRDYSIYFITLVIAIAIFYLFNSIDSQTAMLKLNESTKEIVQTLINLLSYVSVFVAIVLGFLIVYANNFIIKRRKKEIGVYLTLGMSNFRVSMILVLETMMVGIISLVVGTILGIIESRWGFLFLIVLPALIAFVNQIMVVATGIKQAKKEIKEEEAKEKEKND